MNFMKKFRNTLIGASTLVLLAILVAVSPQSCHAAQPGKVSTTSTNDVQYNLLQPNSKLLADSDKEIQKMLDTEQSLEQRRITERDVQETNHEKQRIKLQAKIDLGDEDQNAMDDLLKKQAKERREINLEVAKHSNNVKTLSAILTNRSKLLNQRIFLVQKAANSETLTDKDAAALYHQMALNTEAIKGVDDLQKMYEDHQIDASYRLERDRRAASWNN